MTSLTAKRCLECGEAFNGRTDKKFCSDLCRTAFNNKLNSEDNNHIRTINSILRRNRKILADLNPSGKIKVPEYRLRDRGFNFNYFTSTLKTKAGIQYFYCYEHGYLRIKGDHYLLVIRNEPRL